MQANLEFVLLCCRDEWQHLQEQENLSKRSSASASIPQGSTAIEKAFMGLVNELEALLLCMLFREGDVSVSAFDQRKL